MNAMHSIGEQMVNIDEKKSQILNLCDIRNISKF